jgi:hypothetical protein
MQGTISIYDICHLCLNSKIKWTTHIITRLQERGINPSDIKNCIQMGEIIEYYPDDYPFPSCLILGKSLKDTPLHTVIGVGNGYVWLITSYFPDKNKWESDNKTRKVME